MHARIALPCLAAAIIAGALTGCAKEASSSTTGGENQPSAPASGGDAATSSDWTANGATACERFLTPEVVAAILVNPAGKSRHKDATSCEYTTEHSGNIGITLKVANVDAFRSQIKRIAYAHPMAGVGDAAYWNEAGAVSSVKGSRGCDIEAFGVAFRATKLRDEALGRQLGAICTKLFALP